MHLKYNVNHKNFIIIWRYLEEYAKKNNLTKADINIFDQLDLPYPEGYHDALEFYKDPNRWSPQSVFKNCYLKAKEIAGEPNFFRNCGRSAIKLNSVKSWKDLSVAFSGPGEAYQYFCKFLNDWNDTKVSEIFESISLSNHKSKTIIKYKIHDHIKPESDYCSGRHIQGLLEAIPTLWPKRLLTPWKKLPLASVKYKMVEYDPIKLFKSIYFEKYNLSPRIDGDTLSIKNNVTKKRIIIGRKVFLKKSPIGEKLVYIGEYSDKNNQNGRRTGWLITESVEMDGETICEKGTIFNSPYFLLEIVNEELSITKKVFSIRNKEKSNKKILDEVLSRIIEIKREMAQKERAYEDLDNYKTGLEETIKAKNKELEETQKKIIEKEKILLANQISGGFVHEVRNGLVGSQLAISSLYDYDGSGKGAKKLFFSTLKNIEKTSGLKPKTKKEIGRLKKIGEDTAIVLKEAETAIESVLTLTRKIRLFVSSVSVQTGGERVGINHTLNNVLDRLNRIIKKNKIECTIQGEEIFLKAEKSIIISIFENIILNAIEAISFKSVEGGKIQIETKLSREIEIKITDNGVGIKKNNEKRIFDPFYTNKPGGSGLGLSIVKRFIKIYNGRVIIKSNQGIGTEVIILFDKSILWGEDEPAAINYDSG